MKLTAVQNQILSALHERGRVCSLLKLSVELCMDYKHARRCLVRLETQGLITVQRRPGYPLTFEASEGFRVSSKTGFHVLRNTEHRTQEVKHG